MLAEAVTGKLCTATGATARITSLFVGRFTTTDATGPAATLAGGAGLVALVEKADGTVRFLELGRGEAGRQGRDGGDDGDGDGR